MSGLIVSRRPGESIDITALFDIPAGTRLSIKILNVDRNKVFILTEAPRSFTVDRDEVTRRKAQEQNSNGNRLPPTEKSDTL